MLFHCIEHLLLMPMQTWCSFLAFNAPEGGVDSFTGAMRYAAFGVRDNGITTVARTESGESGARSCCTTAGGDICSRCR